LFVRVELRRQHPMLDLTLFRGRVFSAATASALLNYACVYSVLFVLPFLLIQGRGLTASQAGVVLTAQPIVMAAVAPVSGTMSDRLGSRWLATAGMLLLGIGMVALALLVSRGSLLQIAGALAVVGLGVGTFVSPNNSALMGAAPMHRQGIASGVLASARNVGMVLGVGYAGAVFTTVLARAPTPTAGIPAAVRASLLASSGLAAIGTLLSALRPKR
jgi:MFS family permease